MTPIRDAIAYDASLRRKMRNKARRNGDPMGLLDNNQGGKVDNLLATYTRAKDRVGLLNRLSQDKSPEARQLYKQLQNHWYNRTQRTDDWTCDGRPVTKGKEKRRGKSMPLIKSF